MYTALSKAGIILFIAICIAACDQPRDRRVAHEQLGVGQNSDRNNFSSNGQPNSGPSSSSDRDGVDYDIINDQGQGSKSSGQIPNEISHCRWPSISGGAFASEHQHIGQYTVCQSTAKDTDVYIQVRHPITDSTLCLIPTYHSGNKAIFIGEPRCFEARNSESVYRIGLLKNRPGYSNFNVTGVMIMRDRAYFYPYPFNQYLLSPDAYLFCAEWLDRHNDPSYCQAFDAVGQYIYHRF